MSYIHYTFLFILFNITIFNCAATDSVCGFDGKMPRVYCPSSSRPAPERPQGPTINRPISVSTADVRFHPRVRLLPDICGVIREDNKIINGEAAALYEFPWMALLGYESGNRFEYRCGGTLINRRYVLTAAHCLVVTRYKLVRVRLGEYDLSKNDDCSDSCAPPVQDMQIDQIIPHPHYSQSSRKHDIGLIRLSTDVIFNDGTIPICLPIGIHEQSKELNGEKVTITGWGTTENSKSSSILLKVDIPIESRDQCKQKYSNKTDIGSTQLCGGNGQSNKDSCTGDSGGPLQAITPRGEDIVYVQYGIVSFGPVSCGASDFPGVYTRVGFYMKWILDTMRT